MENFIVDSFIKKYGKQTFSEIKTIIKAELEKNNISTNFDDNYVQYIFEIAAYEYCGIEKNKIALMINKMGNTFVPTISIEDLKNIHNNSILKIQNYLNEGFEDIKKALKN